MEQPFLDKVFGSIEEAKLYFTNLASASRTAFKTLKSEKNARLQIECNKREEMNCPFKATVRINKAVGNFPIITLDPLHHCHGHGGSEARTPTHSGKWIQMKTQEFMQVSPKTTAKQIVTEFRRHGISIPQHAAWKAKTVLTGEDVAEQACQFALIPAYVEHFLEKDPDGTAVISINEATKQFEAVFISPSAASNSWLRNQKFLALDGALTSAAHENLLLLAATFDGKDLLNILSWAFVPTESEATWTWFIELCDQSFGKGMLNSIGTTVISDRQKGLLKAIPAVLPDVHKGFCCVHLLRNLNEKFKQSKGQLEPFFWTIVRALTEKDFERALGKFSKKFGKGPARYLDKIPHNKWAEYTFPGPRYGCVSSNIAECSNVLLKDARTMAPLALLTLIEEWGMGKFAEQSKAAEGRVDEFTAAATTRFLQEEATSREYDIIVSTNRTGFWSGLAKHPLSQSPDHKVTITIPFDYDIHEPTGLPYLQATCTCGYPQDFLLPCRHTIG